MTNQPPDRLTRVENLVEENTRAISELRLGLTDVKSAAETLLQVVTIHQQDFEVIANQIRGIQLENRRLIERFFGTDEA